MGGYELQGVPVSVTIVLYDSRTGVMLPRSPEGDSARVRLKSADSGRVRFFAVQKREPLRFEGRIVGGQMTGAVRQGRGRGRFELARTTRLTPKQIAPWVGDYALAPDDLLVVGRSLTQLYCLESRTGRQRPLWAVDDSTFVAGPTLGTSFPPQATLVFHRDAAGSPTAVDWIPRGARERVGRHTTPYDESEITFASGAVTLAGSVLLPRTPGQHPGIVLVHGSNAQSRNGQQSIYRFHADHFARHGIAVLIYDKRGIGGSGGNPNDAGLDEDALAAARVLRSRPGVDSSRVGLWGLSQGSWLVGQVAAAAPREVAFIIPVGGGALNPHVQEIERTALQMRADGFGEAEIREAAELQRLKFRYARRRNGWDEYLAAVERAKGKVWLDDPYIGPPTTKDSPAWDFWQHGVGGGGVEPSEYLPRVRCPVLAVCGGLDTQSSPMETLTLLDTYLGRGGNADVTLRLFPDGSHAIYEAKTGGPRELPALSRFVSGYLDTLTDWIARKTATR